MVYQFSLHTCHNSSNLVLQELIAQTPWDSYIGSSYILKFESAGRMSLPPSPYSRELANAIERAEVPSTQEANSSSGNRVSRPHGLVRRALSRGALSFEDRAPVQDPHIEQVRGNVQEEVSREVEVIQAEFFTDGWAADIDNQDVRFDILAAIGMLKHTITSMTTSGELSTRDAMRVFLMRYGHRLRAHDHELFFYRKGVHKHIVKTHVFDMEQVCTIAEGRNRLNLFL